MMEVLVGSVLLYGAEVWGRSMGQKYEKAQLRAARLVLGACRKVTPADIPTVSAEYDAAKSGKGREVH